MPTFSNSCTNSLFLCISSIISAPPTNLPSMKTCGNVGQFEYNFILRRKESFSNTSKESESPKELFSKERIPKRTIAKQSDSHELEFLERKILERANPQKSDCHETIRLVDHFSAELAYSENFAIVATKRVRRPKEFIVVLTN
uniref:Uncharacterized protein n=1 Tax=Romanomermis culicivorax TaxID=13658 RepID=A0A915KLX7_ROMCU